MDLLFHLGAPSAGPVPLLLGTCAPAIGYLCPCYWVPVPQLLGTCAPAIGYPLRGGSYVMFVMLNRFIALASDRVRLIVFSVWRLGLADCFDLARWVLIAFEFRGGLLSF
jgi:hypothetical protein